MSRLIVMVGLPGSGKSTEAKKLKDLYSISFDKVEIFSSDTYREKILGNENDQSDNQKVFDTLYRDMKAFLESDSNVLAIFDATNVTVKSRKKIFEILPKDKKIEVVAQVVNTPYATCIDWDNKRDRKVGKDVVTKFYKQYQHPQKFEGFDYIFFTRPYAIEDIKKYDYLHLNNLFFTNHMMNFDQHNPHHTRSLGDHCIEVGEAYNVMDPRFTAGYWHDVGKLFTQTFDDNGIAHYYEHQNVGTYWLITHWNYWVISDIIMNNIQEILFYVNYHMHCHRQFKSEKSKEKFKKMVGEDLFNKLIDFGVKDEQAK